APAAVAPLRLPDGVEPSGVAIAGNALVLFGTQTRTINSQVVTYGTSLRAPLGSSGAVGGFTRHSSLQSALGESVALVLGEAVYLIGGRDAQPASTSLVAHVLPDGDLQPFQVATGVTLKTPRAGHALALIGSAPTSAQASWFAYAIGGSDGSAPLS